MKYDAPQFLVPPVRVNPGVCRTGLAAVGIYIAASAAVSLVVL